MTRGPDTSAMTEQLSLTDRIACLHAMSCLAWADGRLHADELTAARAAARILGLEEEQPGPGLINRRPAMRRVPIHALSPEGRRAVYASAAWMALADGVLDWRERELLRTLQRRLELDDADRARLEDVVYERGTRLNVSWPERYAEILCEVVDATG